MQKKPEKSHYLSQSPPESLLEYPYNTRKISQPLPAKFIHPSDEASTARIKQRLNYYESGKNTLASQRGLSFEILLGILLQYKHLDEVVVNQYCLSISQKDDYLSFHNPIDFCVMSGSFQNNIFTPDRQQKYELYEAKWINQVEEIPITFQKIIGGLDRQKLPIRYQNIHRINVINFKSLEKFCALNDIAKRKIKVRRVHKLINYLKNEQKISPNDQQFFHRVLQLYDGIYQNKKVAEPWKIKLLQYFQSYFHHTFYHANLLFGTDRSSYIHRKLKPLIQLAKRKNIEKSYLKFFSNQPPLYQLPNFFVHVHWQNNLYYAHAFTSANYCQKSLDPIDQFMAEQDHDNNLQSQFNVGKKLSRSAKLKHPDRHSLRSASSPDDLTLRQRQRQAKIDNIRRFIAEEMEGEIDFQD